MKRPLLVFDLDDTLVDSEGAYNRALQKVGLSAWDEKYLTARSQVKATLTGGHVSSRNRWLYFKRFLENQGAFSAKKIIEMNVVYESALLEDLRKQWLFLKRDDLFCKLHQDFDLALLTNENTRTQILKLSVIDPEAKYFSQVVTSEEVGFEKPDSRIFASLVARFPGVGPHEITFIGDSVKNDIEPGLKQGWNVIWTQEFAIEKKDSSFPKVRVIHNLNDILQILKFERN